jgi:hypothetical protein
MLSTDTIVINVPSELAEAYQQVTAPERSQIEAQIILLLKSATLNRQEAISQFRQTMDQASEEAEVNGLTPEILESILHDDE